MIGIPDVGKFVEFVLQQIVKFFADIAHTMIDLLPNAADLNIDIPSGWIRGYTFFDTFLPLHEALAMVGLLLAIYAVVFAWRLLHDIVPLW